MVRGGGMCYVQVRGEIHAGFLIGGKLWHEWKDNIKMNLEWVWTGLIWLTKWRNVVNAVVNFRLP
jgi:hypothetical protein